MGRRSASSHSRFFVPWVLFATACSALMWLLPGEETIPYHLAWIGVALAYGIEAWPLARTLTAVMTYTVVTGVILVERAVTGVIAWEELAEIPLMSALVLLVVWSVHKRHVAFATLTQMAERDRVRSTQRARLSRMVSHEMRTPATIAIGYAEMLLAQESDTTRRADLRVILDELGRLVLAGDRVIRTVRMHDDDHLRERDLTVLLGDTARRWRVLADRHWVVDCESIRFICSADRLRACVDTLLENAVRYTESGDTVRIIGLRLGENVLIGVADSGAGMEPMMLKALSTGEFGGNSSPGAYGARDPKAQTGLGLALVWEAAEARGGRLVAGVSAEGGALVAMVLPDSNASSDTGLVAHPINGMVRRTVQRV